MISAMNMERRGRYNIMRDLAIIVFGIMLAVVLTKTHIVADLIASSGKFKLAGAFVAGIFFTSVFTVPLSAVALLELAKTSSLLWVAFFGALGALGGDLLIFRFFKDHVVEDFEYLLRIHESKRIRSIMHLRIVRFLTPLLGAIIIASPLPDELGIMLMGLSRVKTSLFVPLSLTFNFLGIIVINAIAKAIG